MPPSGCPLRSEGARWGVFCGLRPTLLPCPRTGARCRAGGPPPPTAAGRCAVGAARAAASAGAAREVPRWAGVTGFAKYQFSEGGRLWWPPGKLAPQWTEGPISLQLVFSERSVSRNTLHARPRRGASARARARRRMNRRGLSVARGGAAACPGGMLAQASRGPARAAYRRRGVPPAPQQPRLSTFREQRKSPVHVLRQCTRPGGGPNMAIVLRGLPMS